MLGDDQRSSLFCWSIAYDSNCFSGESLSENESLHLPGFDLLFFCLGVNRFFVFRRGTLAVGVVG
jgi:hypothetical protein